MRIAARACLVATAALLVGLLSACSVLAAPVSVYAGSFTSFIKTPIRRHPVRLEETGVMYHTDDSGYIRDLDLPVGMNATFTLQEGNGFKATQSGTVTVPASGLNTPSTLVALQVPSDIVFDLLNAVLPHKRNFSQCQLVTTCTNFGVTAFAGFPQGWQGVEVSLHPPLSTLPTYYFGTWGIFSNDTNPLPNNLTSLSWDGGVYFMNVDAPVGTEFVITAKYGSTPFSTARVKCLQPGRLVNAAPNQGPRALQPIQALRGELLRGQEQQQQQYTLKNKPPMMLREFWQ